MEDISYDETVAALEEAGLMDPTGTDSQAADAAAAETGAGTEPAVEDGTEQAQDQAGLGEVIQNAAPMLVGAVVGKKLSGSKSTGNVAVDAVTTVVEKAASKDAAESSGKDAPKEAKAAPAKKKGLAAVADKVKAMPEAAMAPMQSSLQTAIDDFAAGQGQEDVMKEVASEFGSAMKEIRKSRRMPSIGSGIPGAGKSVTDFMPGLG